MGKEVNKVIGGDYTEYEIMKCLNGEVLLYCYGKEDILINKSTVDTYELVDESIVKEGTFSRSLLGGLLLGNLGAIAGFLSSNKVVKYVVIYWKNGKKSLIACSERTYSGIISVLF